MTTESRVSGQSQQAWSGGRRGHLWQPWRLQMYWPGIPEVGRPPVRSWVRECGICDSSEYRRLEGGGTPDDDPEVVGLIFPSSSPCA